MQEFELIRQEVHEGASTISRSFIRQGESWPKRWFLFDGDRMHVAGALLVAVLSTLLALGLIWPIEYRFLLEETTMIQTVFNTLLGGVILLVSIVVSVGAVGISQELTTLGEQAKRVNTAFEYRDEIELREDMAVSPAQSGMFLAALLRAIQERANTIESIAREQSDSKFLTELVRLTEDINTNTAELLNTLDRVQAGTTDELLIGLDYDCSWQLYQTRLLLAEFDTHLSEGNQGALIELENTLRSFLIGREYFKSIYYKSEFSDLSTTLLSVSLPVIIFITYILLALDTGIFPELTVFGLSPLSIFISVGYTIALAPYIVLTSYVFRATSVTKRTMAAGPFIIDAESEYSLEQ